MMSGKVHNSTKTYSNLLAGPSGTREMIRGYSNGIPFDSTFTPTPAVHGFPSVFQAKTSALKPLPGPSVENLWLSKFAMGAAIGGDTSAGFGGGSLDFAEEELGPAKLQNRTN
jgi:hypothetical protein